MTYRRVIVPIARWRYTTACIDQVRQAASWADRRDAAVGELSRAWDDAWSGYPPLGERLQSWFPDRWVRFHSLPGSRRYPRGRRDYQTLSTRHHTILAALGAADVYLITVGYADEDLAASSQPVRVGLHPHALWWRSVTDPDDPDALPVDVYVSRHRYLTGSLDRLLTHVADGLAGGVILADTRMRWLDHPYDGGADVIAPSSTDRDRLRDNHRDWLSAHPSRPVTNLRPAYKPPRPRWMTRTACEGLRVTGMTLGWSITHNQVPSA